MSSTQDIWRVSVKNLAVFLRVSVTRRAVRPVRGLMIGSFGLGMVSLQQIFIRYLSITFRLLSPQSSRFIERFVPIRELTPLWHAGESKPGGEPQFFQGTDADPVNVDLLPYEAMAHRCRMSVMVVVPPLSECHEGHPPVVARIVVCFEAATAPDVRSRVDETRGMPRKDDSHADPPQNDGPAACPIKYGEKKYLRYEIPSRYPEMKRIFRKVRHVACL